MRLVWLLLLVAPCMGLVEKLKITQDPRTAFHIESFGFEEGGRVELELSDFQLMVPVGYEPPEEGTFNIAFVLVRSANEGGQRVEDNSPERCFHENLPHDDDMVVSLASRDDWERLKWSTTIVVPGFYHLYFSNCEITTQADFLLEFSEYNVVNGQKVFLPAGLASLPTWFFVLVTPFVGMSVYWLVLLCKSPEDRKSIHWLMLSVVVLKIFSLLFEALRYHTLLTKGIHDGWSVLFYIFHFLKGMMMFTVIVLIGTGWSYLKPFLTDRDKQIVIGVLVVQLLTNVAMVVMDEMLPGQKGWLTWRDLLHILDMICCCLLLFPIIWSIQHLRQAGSTDGVAQRNMIRLKNFRTFYLIVVSYVYFTRIIVFLLEVSLPFEMTWLGPVFSELASVAFYATTGYLFRPQSRNPYLALNKDDDDATEMTSRDEEEGVPSAVK